MYKLLERGVGGGEGWGRGNSGNARKKTFFFPGVVLIDLLGPTIFFQKKTRYLNNLSLDITHLKMYIWKSEIVKISVWMESIRIYRNIRNYTTTLQECWILLFIVGSLWLLWFVAIHCQQCQHSSLHVMWVVNVTHKLYKKTTRSSSSWAAQAWEMYPPYVHLGAMAEDREDPSNSKHKKWQMHLAPLIS